MRSYQESHPWITFKATDINRLGARNWMLLGEARAMCEHLAGVPLQPDVARNFYEVAMVRGAHATTAIEGNTLTEEQVAGILRGTFRAPPSREYQEREVKNALDALNAISARITRGDRPTITRELICEFNRQVLIGTNHESDVVPGQVRDYSVIVSDYRGAPAEDCDYLLDRLAGWLESDTFRSDVPENQFALVVASAIYAHLYIAWLHPFGDGNGRTARLLEFLILARSGMVPLPATHLLSNHYNLTRDQYYRELRASSRTGDTSRFIGYALQGFIDGIREQIEEVMTQQFRVAWINHVSDTMGRFPASPARDRQRSLVLAMPSGEDVRQDELAGLSPNLAAMYGKTGPRTLRRDLNRLREDGLVVRRPQGWRSNDVIMKAFLP